MTINKKQTRYIAVALVVFGVLSMICAVWMQYIGLEKVRYRWEVKKRAMEDLKIEIDTVAGWIKQLESERSNFSSQLFTEEDIEVLIRDILQCSQDRSLKVVGVKKGTFIPLNIPHAATGEGLIKTKVKIPSAHDLQSAPGLSKSVHIAFMPIEFKVQGNFVAMIKLLKCLQGYPRLLSVTDIKIQSTPDYPLLEGQIVIHAYRLVFADGTRSK